MEPPLECLHSFSTSEEDQLASPEKRNDILIIFIKQTSILSIISTPKTLPNQIDHQSLANIIQSRVLLQYAFTPQLGFKRFLGLYSLQNQYKTIIKDNQHLRRKQASKFNQELTIIGKK